MPRAFQPHTPQKINNIIMRSRILTILLMLFALGGLTAAAQVYLSSSMGNHDVVTMQSGTTYCGRIVQHDLVNNKLFMKIDYYIRSTERSSVCVTNTRDVSYEDLSPEFQAWYADYNNATTGTVRAATLVDVADPNNFVDVILLTEQCTADLIWYVGTDNQRQQLGFEKVKHIEFSPIEGATDVMQTADFNEIRGCITSVQMDRGAVMEYTVNVGGAVRTVKASSVTYCSCEVNAMDKVSILHTITTTYKEKSSGFLIIVDNNTIAIVTDDGVETYSPSDLQCIDYVPRRVREFTANGVTFKMVRVEGGTFQRGSAKDNGKKPTHRVALSDYMIGETEVTQELWQAVMGTNPSDFKGTANPVENVSWSDCQDFISKLNSLTGANFRLPTDAEWEFAARGGNESKGYQYSGGNAIDDVAWYKDNSGGKTHPVATKDPNELGLYDMSGNVWEWCQDWYGDYGSFAQTNPQGPSKGKNRVLHSGSWSSGATSCPHDHRGYSSPWSRFNYFGLRLALSPSK